MNSGEAPPQMTRREIFRYLLGFSAVSTLVGVLTPILGYLWPSSHPDGAIGGRTMVGSVEDFAPGTGKVVPVGSKPVIVLNTEQGFRVFSAVCTHLGCIVLNKDPGTSYIHCPCHDGRFNPVNGTVIAGPPPRPLPAYEFSVEEGKIYVGKPLGPLYGA